MSAARQVRAPVTDFRDRHSVRPDSICSISSPRTWERSRRTIVFLAALPLTLFLASGDLAAQASTRDQILARWLAGLDATDPAEKAEQYLAIHTEDAVLMFPGMPPIVGHAHIRSWILAFFTNNTFEFPQWHTETFEVSGDLALHRFSGRAITTPRGGEAIVEERKYLDVWRQVSPGVWKIAIHVYGKNH